MCMDYKMLNSKTLKNAYPLPRIQDCMDKLRRAYRLSMLDMASGYWLIRVTRPQDSIQREIWQLQVFGDAIRAHKCTSYISDANELILTTIYR